MKRIFSVLPLTLAAVGVTAAVTAAVMTVSGAAALPGMVDLRRAGKFRDTCDRVGCLSCGRSSR